MKFDQLCRLAERALPELRRPCREARLFRMEPVGAAREPVATPEQGTRAWDVEEQLAENLRLPFDVVALEPAVARESTEALACVVLERRPDAEPRRHRYVVLSHHQCGRDEHWVVSGEVTYFPRGWDPCDADLKVGVRVESMRTQLVVGDQVRHTCELSPEEVAGQVHVLAEADRGELRGLSLRGLELLRAHRAHAAVLRGRIASEVEAAELRRLQAELAVELGEGEERLQRELAYHHGRAAFAYLGLSLFHLLEVCRPTSFVVEEVPLAPPPRPRPGTLVRSPWRPHYIVLAPDEIRRRLHLARPAAEPGSRPAPHERRGHFRRYQAERYVHRRGQLQWIEACWIGPREAVLGPNKYLVRTDL